VRIFLAPMEGVVDHEMRDVLTRVGGYDRCVTEFVRVTDQLLPERVFTRFAPELEQGGRTSAGTPVFLQLLGSNPKVLAMNAVQAQNLSPLGIDLNFGCPSKTVNRSDGGSALLREPERIYHIVAAVRDAVDPSIPVTAKIRLGFSNHDALDEITDNVFRANADELCIHARTREDRYTPPAYWAAVKKVSEKAPIPVVINGEIWNLEDAKKAQIDSGCEDIMLGRSALTSPDIAAKIKAEINGEEHHVMDWWITLEMIVKYLQNSKNHHPMFVSNRCKQWLVFLQRHYPEAKVLFHRVKRLKKADDVFSEIKLYQREALV
jgi:tRNA-dihydrouridine synthase C